ncbi:hypothetical protein MMC14_001262 [Varicellaria rhodocarpa]|nr:hypothetical protein [Varicellaria rhodocarpa]
MVALPTQRYPKIIPRIAYPQLKSQWKHPTGVFPDLLIVGADIVQRAVAQLAGGPFKIVPVAFSFGWVGYSINALVSALGDGKLMPDSDCPSIVMNARSGIPRQNMSWILGRILRDWEHRCEHSSKEYALIVTIFQVIEDDEHRAGRPTMDRIWYTGFLAIFFQFVIAILPGLLYENWLIATVTMGGTILALAGGALPQWKAEKWSCRKLDVDSTNTGVKKQKAIALTRGNGSKHVIIIYSDGVGLDLEDLAGGRRIKNRSTLPLTLALATSWIIVLLMVSNLSEHAWYLLAVGGVGMAQNLFASGYQRETSAFGIHLGRPDYVLPEKEEEGGSNKVIKVLKTTEARMKTRYGIQCVGINLLPIFFPNGLRPDEKVWRDETKREYEMEDERKHAKAKRLPLRNSNSRCLARSTSEPTIIHRH